MNKYSINMVIPFGIECEEIINKFNGNKYNKRLTSEFKELQKFCKENSIFMSENKKAPIKVENIYYKDVWINLKPDYIGINVLNELNLKIYKVFKAQTENKYEFE